MTSCPACDRDRTRTSFLGRGCYRNFEYAFVTCVSCGSVFADPMPDDGLLHTMYGPDYLDAHYAEALQGEGKDADIEAEQERAIRWLVEARPRARVLDIG